MCSNWQPAQASELQHAAAGPGATALPPSPWQHVGGSASLAVRWQKLEGSLGDVGGPEGLFMHLFGQEGAKDTFWLDRHVVHTTLACHKECRNMSCPSSSHQTFNQRITSTCKLLACHSCCSLFSLAIVNCKELWQHCPLKWASKGHCGC